VYGDAYEVECSDSDGTTIWLAAMYADELGPVDADSVPASDSIRHEGQVKGSAHFSSALTTSVPFAPAGDGEDATSSRRHV
jgi:hypothetical protein